MRMKPQHTLPSLAIILTENVRIKKISKLQQKQEQRNAARNAYTHNKN